MVLVLLVLYLLRVIQLLKPLTKWTSVHNLCNYIFTTTHYILSYHYNCNIMILWFLCTLINPKFFSLFLNYPLYFSKFDQILDNCQVAFIFFAFSLITFPILLLLKSSKILVRWKIPIANLNKLAFHDHSLSSTPVTCEFRRKYTFILIPNNLTHPLFLVSFVSTNSSKCANPNRPLTWTPNSWLGPYIKDVKKPRKHERLKKSNRGQLKTCTRAC